MSQAALHTATYFYFRCIYIMIMDICHKLRSTLGHNFHQTRSTNPFLTLKVFLLLIHHVTLWPWSLTLDSWPLTLDLWPLTLDLWPLIFDPWPLTLDLWPLISDPWLLTFDPWPLTFDSWPLTFDPWLLTFDPWSLTVDPWPLTLDLWPLSLDLWLLTFDPLTSEVCSVSAVMWSNTLYRVSAKSNNIRRSYCDSNTSNLGQSAILDSTGSGFSQFFGLWSPTMHRYDKFQHNLVIRNWVIHDSTSFAGPFLVEGNIIAPSSQSWSVTYIKFAKYIDQSSALPMHLFDCRHIASFRNQNLWSGRLPGLCQWYTFSWLYHY